MPSKNELVVVLLDVLGFEERIGRFSLEEVHGQYKDLLSIATNKGSHALLNARPVGDGTMVPFIGFINIEKDYFSDTILLWSPFSPAMLKPFLYVCCSFMYETLQAELPIRGAIALGSAIMKRLREPTSDNRKQKQRTSSLNCDSFWSESTKPLYRGFY